MLVSFTFVVFWFIRAHLVTSKWVNQLFASFILKLVQIRWCVLYWFPIELYCCSWREGWTESEWICCAFTARAYRQILHIFPQNDNSTYMCKCVSLFMNEYLTFIFACSIGSTWLHQSKSINCLLDLFPSHYHLQCLITCSIDSRHRESGIFVSWVKGR